MLRLSNLRFDPSGFHWVLASDDTNVIQTRYRVQLASDNAFVSTLWDSGEVSSDASICVPYGGDPLPCGALLFWRAMVTDNHGNHSDWSAPQSILTGLAPQDWTAMFITPDTPGDADHSKGKLLRKEFFLESGIQCAILHATALGVYELRLNGARVGDALLCPGWTQYEKRLLHQSYDVAGLLTPGANAIGAMLGAGWYKGDLASWTHQRAVYGRQTALLLELVVRYADGREQRITSDIAWKYSDGPILFSELYHGEIYDARLEQPGWDMPRFDDGAWQGVDVLNKAKDSVTPQDGPLVRPQEVLAVHDLIVTPKGERVLDFGQNIAGFVRFRVSGNVGQRVLLRHAEVLDKDGNFYTENMRSARNEIVYTLRGNGEEVFQPHFTFQGFRYVHVAEYPGEIAPESFEAQVIHSDLLRTGTFECSNPLLNQLHSNILRGLKGNFVDIPSDCPQRDERLGWTGDAQVFARTATYLCDTQAFFRKWLRDLRAAQFDNGGVPFVVPDVLTGKFPEGDIIANAESVTGWGDAAVIVPWTMYLAYGDLPLLAESYGSMKAWVEYIRCRASHGLLWNNDYQLGDWVALDAREGSYFGATATDLIATAYYARCAELLSKAATALGLTDDAAEYASLRTQIDAAYKNEFFSPNGRLVSPTQTAHILSLAFGLTPGAFRSRTVKGLAELLDANDGHLTTGFLGTPYFCQVLADCGEIDRAYDLLLKTDYPSWLYQITRGATTVWEHWDGIKPDGSMWSADMNSFNHYAYGSVAEFLYKTVAGLDTNEAAPGYKQLLVQPKFGGGLTHARAEVATPYGMASVAWKLDERDFTLAVLVPHNTSAHIILPDGIEYTVGSGMHDFLCEMHT